MSGSLGQGFYKAAYKSGKYYLNDKIYNRDELIKKVSVLKNYIITEFLHTHANFEKFSKDTVNCIRYLTVRDDLGHMKMIKSFIRFGTKKSGFVENYNSGGILCYISKDGQFNYGNMFDKKENKNMVISNHPDTNVALCGKIPCWDEITRVAELFGKIFPQLKYLGIDLVVTDESIVKVLEINSLTSLDSLQLDHSILETPEGMILKHFIT